MNTLKNRRRYLWLWLLVVGFCMILTACAFDSLNNTTGHATIPSVAPMEPNPSMKPTTPEAVPTDPTVPNTVPTESTVTEPTSTEPSHTHSYTQTVTTPTCTDEGYTTFFCDCGDSYVGEMVNALGHSYSDWIETVAPTTEAVGEAERQCAVCGNKETKILEKIIEDHTHTYTSEITKTATCTAEGIRTFTCSCGSSYTESVEALGHDYTTIVTAPTCTAEGYTTHTCKRCESSYTDTIVSATGHSYSFQVTVKATCTEDGVRTFTCEHCSDNYTEVITKLGHEYSSHVTEPSCTQKGYTTYTCVRCNDSYKDNYTDMTDHSYAASVTKEPTCDQEGVRTYTCVCGKSYTEAIAKTDHSYASTIVAPSCTDGGYTKYVCKNCGNSYTDNNTAALGHSYKHTVVAPGCENGGYTTHTCSRCNESYTDSQTPATGHNYEFVSDTANCTQDGIKTEACINCGKEKTSSSKATGHVNTKTETKPSDCENDGYERVVCVACGHVISETVIPSAGGHNYVAERMSDVAIEKVSGDNPDLHFANYTDLTDWDVDVCSNCRYIDLATLRFAYTPYEAAEIMLGYVNELRAEYYGTDKYAMELDMTLVELANIRAKEIMTDFSHRHVADGENIAKGSVTIHGQFIQWCDSPEHKGNMLGRWYVKFGYGFAWTYNAGFSPLGYGVQLFMLHPDLQ